MKSHMNSGYQVNIGAPCLPFSLDVLNAASSSHVATLTVRPDESIMDLKCALQSRIGAPTSYQSLLVSGSTQELVNNQTIEASGLRVGTPALLVLKIGESDLVNLLRADVLGADSDDAIPRPESLASCSREEGAALAKYLLSHGADPNADGDGNFAGPSLIYAAKLGRGDIIELLLHDPRLADVNVACRCGPNVEEEWQLPGETALNIVCSAEAESKDHIHAGLLLIQDARVDLNLPDECGNLAFGWAVSQGHCELVQSFLQQERFTSFNEPTPAGKFALTMAAANVLPLLLQDDRFDQDVKSLDGSSFLLQLGAYDEATWAIVCSVLRGGRFSEVAASDVDGMTLLHQALEHGAEDVYKLLLEDFRVDVNAQTGGSTLLHCACSSYPPDAADDTWRAPIIARCKAVIQHDRFDFKASVSAGNLTPLHVAIDKHIDHFVRCSDQDLEQVMTECSALVNGAHLVGSCFCGLGEIVELFLSDERFEGMNASSAHSYALQGLFKYALNRGDGALDDIAASLVRERRLPDINGKTGCFMGFTALHIAAAQHKPDICRLILQDERFTEVNAFSGQGETALSVVTCYEDDEGLEFVRALLEDPRVDVNLRCESGSGEVTSGLTALQYAAYRGSLGYCQALLSDKRSDLNIKPLGDTELEPGTTLLHILASQGSLELCRQLLDDPRFSEAHALDSNGATALDLVVDGGESSGDLSALLREHGIVAGEEKQ